MSAYLTDTWPITVGLKISGSISIDSQLNVTHDLEYVFPLQGIPEDPQPKILPGVPGKVDLNKVFAPKLGLSGNGVSAIYGASEGNIIEFIKTHFINSFALAKNNFEAVLNDATYQMIKNLETRPLHAFLQIGGQDGVNSIFDTETFINTIAAGEFPLSIAGKLFWDNFISLKRFTNATLSLEQVGICIKKINDALSDTVDRLPVSVKVIPDNDINFLYGEFISTYRALRNRMSNLSYFESYLFSGSCLIWLLQSTQKQYVDEYVDDKRERLATNKNLYVSNLLTILREVIQYLDNY